MIAAVDVPDIKVTKVTGDIGAYPDTSLYDEDTNDPYDPSLNGHYMIIQARSLY